MMRRLADWAIICLIITFWACLPVMVATADTLHSAHYLFDESTLGGGGLNQSSSANYQVTDALGDAAVGNSASANFQVNAGSKTSPDPTLSFGINNAAANFGSFSPASAATATASFSVSDYTSYGYVVQVVGSPPKNTTGHTISPMSSTAGSQSGKEQFGMNLVANTSPVSLGTNPVYGPFGVGTATANYGTSNNYRYVPGETIASAPKSSGLTTYTISYIINVDSLTPGGQYNSNQVLICTGTY